MVNMPSNRLLTLYLAIASRRLPLKLISDITCSPSGVSFGRARPRERTGRKTAGAEGGVRRVKDAGLRSDLVEIYRQAAALWLT